MKKDYWIIFWIEYSWKKLYWIILWDEFYREVIELIIFWIDICHFWWKSPFLVYFGHFLGTFPIRLVSMILWLLNWIIFWIESVELFLNWILFWIESWLKQYWIEYWMNHFLAKFKHWIESDWVSPTTKLNPQVWQHWERVKLHSIGPSGWFEESPDDSWGIYACIHGVQIFSAGRTGRDGTGPIEGSTRGPRGPKKAIGLAIVTGIAQWCFSSRWDHSNSSRGS